MSKPGLISDPGAITSEWLNAVLDYAGISASVTGFEADSIGTGQVGENVRFKLSGTGDLPASLVGKFPSPDPVSRQTGITQLNYKREVHFYNNLQATLNIQTPEVLFAEVDQETHDFVIIMEDLAPGRQGDQLAGCDASQAETAMIELAHLHGPRWGDDSLVDGEIVTRNSADGGQMLKALYDMVTPGFLDRYQSRLTGEEQEMVSLVGENLIAYMSQYQGPMTLIHIDYRLDNMMFDGPYPLAVVDWQSIAYGCAMNDAAYFIGTSLREDERKSAEEALLRAYHETLRGYDVDCSWETCWHYYRHFAPAGLIMAVIASMIVGETDRGNDMFMAMAKRSARMCRDLDTIDVIRS
ncbi:MAG: phosphotransferase [Proteobacteria bacterium]|nr:phosphotransferase [Pseudomonadota bacterium]